MPNKFMLYVRVLEGCGHLTRSTKYMNCWCVETHSAVIIHYKCLGVRCLCDENTTSCYDSIVTSKFYVFPFFLALRSMSIELSKKSHHRIETSKVLKVLCRYSTKFSQKSNRQFANSRRVFSCQICRSPSAIANNLSQLPLLLQRVPLLRLP